jgi:gluconate 2-dehydrogenase gamma chain
MDRREVLRLSTMMLGGALSASTISGVLAGCKAEEKSDWTPAFIPKENQSSLTELCETILPGGKTPGAKDAKVDRFIDVMMKDVFKPEDQATFKAGLAKIDEDAKSKYGKTFGKLKQDQRVEMVKAMDDELRNRKEVPKQKPFYDLVKELTITGYCTSEAGATKLLKYLPVPGEYKPFIPLSEVGGAWAL